MIDHHCHGVVRRDLDRAGFEALLGEGTAGTFDSAVGLAVRRWCAPVLDLPEHAGPASYLDRRAELGWREVSTRLLSAAGVTDWLLDTGFEQGSLTGLAEFAELSGGRTHEIARLESIAEEVARTSSAAGLFDGIEQAIRATEAVGLKTIAAYRCGLDFPLVESPPVRAAEAWLRSGGGRLTDPELIGWLVGTGARIGAELGLPLQFHTGFGDPDLVLHRADPSLLTGFLRENTDTSIMLLHCWPFHRNAGYLAHVFRNVSVDVGLAIPYVGHRSTAVLAELLELAPYDSVLFSSDGYGLPELHYLGSVLWRRAMTQLTDTWIADGAITPADADRLIESVAHGNASGIYPRI
jgi:uncharacterized protein